MAPLCNTVVLSCGGAAYSGLLGVGSGLRKGSNGGVEGVGVGSKVFRVGVGDLDHGAADNLHVHLVDKLGGVGDGGLRRGGPVRKHVDGLVPHLVEDVVEHDLKAARVAVVVHGQDEEEAVGALDGLGEGPHNLALVLVDVLWVCLRVEHEGRQPVDRLVEQVVWFEGRELLDLDVRILVGKDLLDNGPDVFPRAHLSG